MPFRVAEGMPVDLDTQLVDGFGFRCLPGCGLCCYTTPSVAPTERDPLIQLDPKVPLLEGPEGWSQIASRPEGGACYFLRQERCGCHAVRPATCAEFPLTVHIGPRAQVSVVLSCPGVDLARLRRDGSSVSSATSNSELRIELDAVRREIGRAEPSGQLRRAFQRRRGVERRLRRAGAWQPEEEVRRRLQDRLDSFIPNELLPEDLPNAEDPLEALPMFFDPALGRLVWRSHTGGVEFLALRESGGTSDLVQVLATPTRSPGLDEASRSLLREYLGYLLARDATISMAYASVLEGPSESPTEVVTKDLRAAARQVIRMAVLRRALTTDRRGVLVMGDIENGIRATDMDFLDRPVVGLRL